MGLSAVLIVKNEEKNIRTCLGCLGFADEIIVVDSGSTDKTVELAKLFTPRVFSNPFSDFAGQKNYACREAGHNWILSIDADERVSADLQSEIKETISHVDALDAYRIQRRTNFFGRDFSASGLQEDAPVRLFQKNKGIIFKNPVHEFLDTQGKKVGKLNHSLYHISFQTIHEHLARLQLYTSLEAKNTGIVKINQFKHFFARPFYRFFSIYMLKQGFRDGIEGFFYAVLSGYYEWVRWMKQWEKKHENG